MTTLKSSNVVHSPKQVIQDFGASRRAAFLHDIRNFAPVACSRNHKLLEVLKRGN
jgi:hypothetical protein